MKCVVLAHSGIVTQPILARCEEPLLRFLAFYKHNGLRSVLPVKAWASERATLLFGLLAKDKCRTPPQVYLDSLFPDHFFLVFRAFERLFLLLSAAQTVPKPFVLDVVGGDLEAPQAFPLILFILEPEESIAMIGLHIHDQTLTKWVVSANASSEWTNRIMAQIFLSFHVCGPLGAQYLAVSTSSRAFSGHVMIQRFPHALELGSRRTIVTQGFENHRISVN